jgi:hypothetical protein
MSNTNVAQPERQKTMMSDKFPLSEELAKRFVRLNALRKALDSTLRVQMERSMELYADLDESFHQIWEEFIKTTPLDTDKTWEIKSDDARNYFVQERKVAMRDSTREEKP